MARDFEIGLLLHLVNTHDWDRYEAGVFDRPAKVSDAEVLDQAKRFLLQAEPWGFDAIWITEHHRTPYGMCPNPLQFLAYFAGRTQKIGLGTAVVVLPWHDPLRVAEDIALLDDLAGDRRIQVGFGRGAAASEYEHLRIDQSTSRERFDEGIEIIRAALTQESFRYDGKIFHPQTSLRPRPRHPELVDDFYCAFVGEGSLRSAARLGLGMGFAVTKDFKLMREDINLFNGIRAERGLKPERPLVVSHLYCAETEAAAHEGAMRHMHGYYNDNVRHYHWSQLGNIKGYEYYGGDAMKGNLDFMTTSVWGTPEMCVAKIKETSAQTGMKHLQISAWYGEMPLEEAEKSVRLFVDKVMPQL